MSKSERHFVALLCLIMGIFTGYVSARGYFIKDYEDFVGCAILTGLMLVAAKEFFTG